jgi:hypothetical protein
MPAEQRALTSGAGLKLPRRARARGGGESVAPPAFLFCSFAGCVSSIPSYFLLGRHHRLTLGLFGRRERLDFLCFALGL